MGKKPEPEPGPDDVEKIIFLPWATMEDIAREPKSRPPGRRPLSVRIEWNDPAKTIPTADT